MDEDRATISAEYQGADIDVYSSDPLIGRLEMVSEEDEIVEVMLDRENAEELLAALVQFLAHGDGGDAPNISTVQ